LVLDPFLAAPQTRPQGGLIYFDEETSEADLDRILVLFGINPSKEYAVFAARSRDPQAEGYLEQLRFVPRWALSNFIGAGPPPAQSLDLSSALKGFVQAQRTKWLDERVFSQRLQGLAGGVGDGASECLGFGLWAENPIWNICRVWSRAWICLS
jgi:hypothetical protein